MSKLQGKVAFITGSTSGIGLGIAKVLAGNGCHIALNGFGDAAEIESIRNSLAREYGVKVIYNSADVTNYESLEKALSQAAEQLGSLDIMVNNAGIQHVSPIVEFPIDKWRQIIDINLNGVFYGVRAALKIMQKQGRGRIINIASVHGLVASANKAAYVSAKHGVIGLTKVAALENAPLGITCNAICPGWVLTPLVQKQIDAKMTAENLTLAQATSALLSEKQPNQRFATAEEIGEMVLYLSSPAAAGVTGSAFTIDGGWVSQ